VSKRILHIIPTLERLGAEKQLTLLATALDREEFDVHVCAINNGGPYVNDLEAAGISTTILNCRIASPTVFRQLKREITRVKPDIVQTWRAEANLWGRIAARRCGVKQTVACEPYLDPRRTAIRSRLDRHLTRSTSKIVVNSQGVKDFLTRRHIQGDLITIIPNGVGPASSSPCPRSEILDELKLLPNTKLIGMAAALEPQKRIKDAIWAADLLKVMRDDVHLLVLGDGPMRDRLIRFQEAVRIKDHVHFLGTRNDVLRFIPHFDLYWSTSSYESQSNGILEAMAASVPVLATDIPGSRELVSHKETGWIIPTYGNDFRRRRSEFARQSQLVLDDGDLLKKLGKAARNKARDQFSVEQMIEYWSDLYRELLR
jgi:glycosyltransferase involved in cell wall biosynthesis